MAEDGSDKGQVVIHDVHSKLQFPSTVPLAYVTFLTKVLILLLPEKLQMAIVCYQGISRPIIV
jgi:hypothetical protein